MSLLKTLRAYYKSRSALEWTVLFLITIVGVSVSFAVYHAEIAAEKSVNRLNFEIAANRNLLSLMESVSDIEAAFGSLQDFYHASEEVRRDEFGIFVKRMLKRNPGLQALEWVPKVTNDALPRFVDAARKDGLHNFEIKEKDPQGKLIQRSEQTEYFPVYYLEPYHGNEPALGFDAASEPRRRAILDRSRDSGLVIATEQIRLVQEKDSQAGFVVFVPVYLKGASTNTVEERHNNLQGFFVGIFRTGDFLSQSFGNQNSDGINMCVYEQVAPGLEQPIYCGIDVHRTDSSSNMRKESDSLSRLHVEKEFDIWGRKWLVICVPEPGSPRWLTNTKTPVFSLFGFLALTGMFLTYVSSLQRGKAASTELAETRLRAQHELEAQIKSREATLDALNQNKELLNTVLQAASVGIGLIKDRVIEWTNDAMEPLTGYLPEELVGRPSREFYASDQEYERCGALTYSEIAIKSKSTIEALFRKKDGTVVEVLMNLSAINKDDLSAGAVFVLTDISESRKMARQLEENVLRMERAEIAAKFGNWELDLISNRVKGSKGALHIYGLQQDEMDLGAVKKFPLPEYRAKLDEALSALIQYQKPYDILFKAVRQLDDKIVDIHATANFHPETNVVWGVIQDVTEQKQAEEALVRSEAKYRMLTENMKDVIWSSDSALRLEYLSPSFEAFSGYTPEEVYGKTIFHFLTPEFKENISQLVQERVKHLEEHKFLPSHKYELEMIKKDGERIWVELVSTPNLDSNGNFNGFQGVARDITERKMAEEALRENEAKFRSYVESSPIGIFEADAVGKILSTNTAYAKLFGNSIDGMLGKNIMDPVVDRHRAHCIESYESLKHAGPVSADMEVITVEGDIIWLTVTAVKLSDDRFLLFSQDITDRKNAEAELQASSNEILQLMKSMINGFVVFESVFDEAGEFVDCRYLYTNDAFDRIQGLSGKDLVGKTVYEVWPDTEQAWIQNFKDVALTGIGRSFEMYHAPMSKYYYCTVYRPWESNDRFCLIFEDITERKRAQEELLEMERKLLQSQKLESLGVLAGGIAHDFNNLLAVIIGNIELAQEVDFDSAEKALFLGRAMSASIKSAGLVRQMLDYSGKGAFELSDVNLSELVHNNIDLFRMTVPKNINLDVESSDDDIFIKADASQIQQVIMNLLINAAEAVDGKNGTVEITTGAQYCDRSLISKSLLPEKPEPQDMAFIRVKDDGCGMEGDTVNRIFDPFFSTKFVGRGLGMSVVHGVVRGHGGAVTIDSQPQVGSTITVYLPLLYRTGHADGALHDPKSRTALTEEKSPETKKFSVLVVDDEQEVLDLVLRQLGHLGCQTLSAMNGKEALDVFTKNPEIDLVILDLVMPEMGGVETFDRLKLLKPELMIVICSGYNEEKIKDDFKSELTPTAFMMKPYRLAALKDLLELLMGERPANGKEPLH